MLVNYSQGVKPGPPMLGSSIWFGLLSTSMELRMLTLITLTEGSA